MHPAAGDRLNRWSQALAGCVDCIGSHGIAHIIDQVDDQECANWRIFDQAHLHIARAATQALEHRIDFRRFGQESFLLLQQGQASGMGFSHLQHLHLPDHLWRGGVGDEPPAGAGQPGHK